MTTLSILMAQMNTLVGDFAGNTNRVIETIAQARGDGDATVLVFPELTLSGYPPEDLLLRPSIDRRVNQSLERILGAMNDSVYVVIGYPRRHDGRLYNIAGVLHRGEIIAEYRKQELPNYQVFDEKRYFSAGTGKYPLGRSMTSCGRIRRATSLSTPLPPSCNFNAAGTRAANSTSSWSRNGTRA